MKDASALEQKRGKRHGPGCSYAKKGKKKGKKAWSGNVGGVGQKMGELN